MAIFLTIIILLLFIGTLEGLKNRDRYYKICPICGAKHRENGLLCLKCLFKI